MNPSLYGKNPGKLRYDTKYIQNCSEIELFQQVSIYYSCVKRIEYATKLKEFYQCLEDEKMVDYFDQMIEKEKEKNIVLKTDYQEFLYTLDYCILQTARFGTKVVYNPKGRVQITEEFKTWYQNWQNYILCMDDIDYYAYSTCRYEGKGFQYFQLNQPIPASDISDFIEHTDHYQLVKRNIKQISA